MTLPPYADAVLQRLSAGGFEAYIVGGCVRDMLLSRIPHDWDICTNAKPDEIVSSFPDYPAVLTGAKYGTVTIVSQGYPVEVTTYRVDGPYQDARRPQSVEYTETLKQDLSRRDFTINAMAWSPQAGLIDLFGGQQDCTLKVVRCVGEASARFQEDALRMLRAVRFCAQLGASLAPETAQAITAKKHLLQKISAERVREELIKLLLAPHPELGLSLLRTLSLPQPWKDIPIISQEIYAQTVSAVKYLPEKLSLRLAALFSSAGKACRAELLRLRFDRKTIADVEALLFLSSLPLPQSEEDLRRFLARSPELALDALLLKEALAPQPEPIRQCREKLAAVKASNPCVSLSQLAVNGRDLISLGISNGKEIGNILAALLELVLKEPQKNQTEILLSDIKEKKLPD